MDKSLTTPQVINALEEFRKKHPGRLRLRTQLRVTWVEDITKFELRDKFWKEPSITTKSGAVYKFSEVYTGIFMEDFYEEPCSVLRYDQDHPDELRYYLNITINYTFSFICFNYFKYLFCIISMSSNTYISIISI